MEEKQNKMNTDWAGLFGEGASVVAEAIQDQDDESEEQ